MNNIAKDKGKNNTGAWIIIIISIIYGISPVDIIPDTPVIGWIDDFIFIAASILNLVQTKNEGKNETISKVARMTKWILISAGIIITLLILIFGSIIVAIFSSSQ